MYMRLQSVLLEHCVGLRCKVCAKPFPKRLIRKDKLSTLRSLDARLLRDSEFVFGAIHRKEHAANLVAPASIADKCALSLHSV